MTGSKVHFVALACSVVLALAACKSGDDDSASTGTGGTGAIGTGGMGAVGTGGTTAGGTGGTTAGGTGGMSGAAGMGAPPGNMPNAMCLAGATMAMPMCDACACTPNAMNGCLEQLTACVTDTNMMAATACKALIDCASRMNCSGTACTTPCMAEVTAAVSAGSALTNAMAVGDCTSTKCMAVCPH